MNASSPPDSAPVAPVATAPSPRRHSPRRVLRAGALALALVAGAAFAGGWALPNVAGGMFVHVRAVVRPVASSYGPEVAIGAAPVVRAGSIAIAADVENTYPLAVILAADPVVYSAAVYARGSSGSLTRVWQTGAGDPVIEEGSDSPVGGGTANGAVVVPPGVSRHEIANGSSAYPLTGSSGVLPAGIYYVRVWAYGIGSSLVPISVDAGPQPLDTSAVPLS
jgi:hypothetical protein